MRLKLTFLLLVTLVLLGGGFCYLFWPIEGLVGSILISISGEDTEWAPRYADREFRKVRVGMNRAEVHSLLGPPLSKWSHDGKRMYEEWTRRPTDTHYRRRIIVFESDAAIEIDATVYLD